VKYYIAQSPTPQPQSETIYVNSTPKSTGVTFEVLISLLIGGIGALGLPRLLNAFAAEKIKNVESERRKDDGAYATLYTALESMLNAMTLMNSTMAAGQSSTASESFQLMNILVQEIALLREVVSQKTEVMKKVSDVMENLTLQSHESYGIMLELSRQVDLLKSEVSQLTRKT
jgi:hypothetical protein